MSTMTDGVRVEAGEEPLDVSFDAVLEKSPAQGGWTYVVWPRSAEFFGTHGLVKVAGTIDGEPFQGSFMALGDGRHKLAVTAKVRRAIGKEEGASVHVHLTARR
jgi:hypothetical protein